MAKFSAITHTTRDWQFSSGLMIPTKWVTIVPTPQSDRFLVRRKHDPTREHMLLLWPGWLAADNAAISGLSSLHSMDLGVLWSVSCLAPWRRIGSRTVPHRELGADGKWALCFQLTPCSLRWAALGHSLTSDFNCRYMRKRICVPFESSGSAESDFCWTDVTRLVRGATRYVFRKKRGVRPLITKTWIREITAFQTVWQGSEPTRTLPVLSAYRRKTNFLAIF